MIDVETICRKLKPIIGRQADELWHLWLASNWQERKELEIDVSVLAERYLTDKTLGEKPILLPPPSEEQAKGKFILGDVAYHNRKITKLYLREEDFIKQIGIFSITGAGKTNTSMLLALELLKHKIPFMVIDWKRQWRSILTVPDFPEFKDLRVYTIGRDTVPFSWNPFRPPKGVDYKTWLSVIIECLEKSHLAGLGVADFVIRIYEKLYKEMKDEKCYPNFYDGMNELENFKVGGREFLWWQSTKRIFKSFCFGPSAKAFNTRDPIKLEELLDKPVIFELDQEMPKPLRIFFSEIILRFIHLYRLNQGETDELRHVLFLEEIHNLTQKMKYEKDRIDSLENVYREIRSFGQGLVSITQHPSTLPTYVLGNSRTLIFLALQHEADVEAARRAMFLPREEEQYFNMLKTGFGIVKIMGRINPCHVRFFYVPVKKGDITDEWLKTNMWGYSKPIIDGKTSINRGYSQGDKKEDGFKEYPPILGDKFLTDIFHNPLSSVTQRYKRIGIYFQAGNQCKDQLIEKGFIVSKKIITGTGWITLFELTQKGKAVLRDLGYKTRNDKESIIHKFWKHRIAEYYKNKNFEVLVEEHINGKPDIIVLNRGRKTAIEIETGNSDAISNIEKNIKAGFDEIVCIATNKDTEEKIKQELQRKNLDKKVTLTLASNFNF
ncbi:ATP-binding protein [Candidatus Woesearchaeota archaeon]|nr:ATP-binding protein [Candidatus Woesearchaeota archaeon]